MATTTTSFVRAPSLAAGRTVAAAALIAFSCVISIFKAVQFVHSYGVRDWVLRTKGRTRPPLVTWTEYAGDRFVAAVENGPLSATQFHPEKSGDDGALLLHNWVQSL